jgi:peptidoglycan LD-endopeptidase LytH
VLAALGLVASVTGVSHAVGASAPVAAPPPATTAAQAVAAQPRIEVAATVTKRAKRLRSSGKLRFPIDPVPRCDVLTNFGEPRSGGRRHEGIDILATAGQAIHAVADGTLIKQDHAASAPLSGNAWGLRATDGQYYYFAHLSAFADGLEKGDTVEEGQLIGYVGDTGNPGPGNNHLHFEVHPKGLGTAAVDPMPLLEIPSGCTVA